MTLPATRAPRLSRRTRLLLVALLVLTMAWLGYFARYGQCDTRSRFCVVDIVGTRSEIGVAWVGRPDFYVSTYPVG